MIDFHHLVAKIAARLDADPLGVADAVWLSGRMVSPAITPRHAQVPPADRRLDDLLAIRYGEGYQRPEGQAPLPPPSWPEAPVPPPGSAPPAPDRRIVRLPAAEDRGKEGVHIPLKPLLGRPRLLAAALRPLRRPSHGDRRLDEARTVERSVTSWMFTPVWERRPRAWYRGVITIDPGLSMLPWHGLPQELSRVVRMSGAFVDVRRVPLETTVANASGATYRLRQESDLRPSRQHILFIISDLIDSAWTRGALDATFDNWKNAGGTVVILHVLEPHLWSRTRVSAGRLTHVYRLPGGTILETGCDDGTGQTTAWRPGRPEYAPAAAVDGSGPADAAHEEARDQAGGTGAGVGDPGSARSRRSSLVPILAIEREWFDAFTRLMNTDGASCQAFEPPVPQLRPGEARAGSEPRHRLDRFLGTASRPAKELARRLSALPVIHFALIRMIREAVYSGSSPYLETELIAGGLLRLRSGQVGCSPWELAFEFYPTIQEELFRGLTKREALETLTLTSAYLEKNLHGLHGFAAMLEHPEAYVGRLDGRWSVFAEATVRILRRLGPVWAALATPEDVFSLETLGLATDEQEEIPGQPDPEAPAASDVSLVAQGGTAAEGGGTGRGTASLDPGRDPSAPVPDRTPGDEPKNGRPAIEPGDILTERSGKSKRSQSDGHKPTRSRKEAKPYPGQLSSVPTLELIFQSVAGNPWEGNVVARFQGEPGRPVPVVERITARQQADLRWYIEEYPYSAVDRLQEARAQQIEQSLVDYGRHLWQGIGYIPEVKSWLGAVQATHALQAAGELPSGSTGRLELRAQSALDEAAFRSPWELMRAGNGMLLHQLGVTVVRRLVADLPRLQLPDTSSGLRVLAIVCRPDDTGFLDPRYGLEAMLEALAERPEVSIDVCRPGTLAALVKALEAARDEGRPYHVLHFDGHGTIVAEQGGIGALCFEDAHCRLDLVRSAQLGDLMARFQVPLVVLDACRTSMQAFAQEAAAGALLRKGVGTVLGMGFSVHVDMTRVLMGGFYGAIAKGKTLGDALQAGRNDVFANSQRRMGQGPEASSLKLLDWFVPQLYQSGVDPALLSREVGKPAGARAAKGTKGAKGAKVEPVWHGFPPEPRAGFQGRAYALHRLERAVQAHPVVVLHATGGMGKTALAMEAARWWVKTGLFPDGAVFVSLARTPSPEALVSQVGESLDGEKFLSRRDPEGWVAEQLEKRRLLVVWDNFESVLPAFNGGTPLAPEYAKLAKRWSKKGSRVLITSRDGEVGFPSWPVALEPLSEPEGLFLLVRLLERLGIDRPGREQRGWTGEGLAKVVHAAGGHALALELVAPHIAKLGPLAVAAELDEILASAQQAHGEDRNRSMEASLRFSMRHLSAEARAVLPAVGLMAGGCLETMAPHILGVDQVGWTKLRGELERAGLVRVEGLLLKPHPVLGDVKTLEPESEVGERFLGVVLSFCVEFNSAVRSEHAKSALSAMSVSEGVVRRAIGRAVEAGDVRRVVRMVDSMNRFLVQSGRGGEGARLTEAVYAQVGGTGAVTTEEDAALERNAAMWRAASDPAGALRALEDVLSRLDGIADWDTRWQRALTYTNMAWIHYDIARQPSRALGPLEEAERLFMALEGEGRANTCNRAAVLGDRASVLSMLGRLEEALGVAEQGLELDRQRNDLSSVARGHGQIAQIFGAFGRHREAEERYREAIEAAYAAGDEELLRTLWQHLGVLAGKQNRSGEASSLLRRAFEAFQRAGDSAGQMQVLNSLGVVELRSGEPEAALAWFERSLELAIRLGDRDGQATARSNRANVFSQQAEQAGDAGIRERRLHQAIAEARVALAIKRELGLPRDIAISLNNLANCLHKAGQLEEARVTALKALELREQIRDPAVWRPLQVLENIALAVGDTGAAEGYHQRREAAQVEARRLSGAPLLPTELVTQLLQLALAARQHRTALEQALTAAGAGDGFLAQLEPIAPWLIAHLRALAEGGPKPSVSAPTPFPALLDEAWEALS